MSGIIGGGLLLAGAVGKGIYGATQNAKASAIEKNNIRPTQMVQPEYEQNVRLAEQMARGGLPQQQYLNQLNGINANQGGAIQTLGRSANPGSGVASVVRAGNDAMNTLNAQDAAARNRNTLALMQQKGILAGAKQNAWNYNYADKYSENLAKSQALRGAGTQNIAGALSDVGQAGQMALGSGMFNQSSAPVANPGAISKVLPGATLNPTYFKNGIQQVPYYTNWQPWQ